MIDVKKHKMHNSNRAVQPYNVFSNVYDFLMSHVDYTEWAEYIDNIFKKYGERKISSVVDCACGTGSLAGTLSAMFYKTAGFDISMNMIKQANAKHFPSLCLWQGDLTSIALKQEWDAALCLYDSLQYLPKISVEKFFKETSKIIVPGGLLLFDLVSELHLITYWANTVEHDIVGEWEITRHSKLNRRLREQHTYFTFKNIETGKTISEHHIQYVYSIDEIVSILTNNGFKQVGIFDDFSNNRGTEKSDRVHILCRTEAKI